MTDTLDKIRKKQSESSNLPQTNSDPTFIKRDVKALGNKVHTQKIYAERYNSQTGDVDVLNAEIFPAERVIIEHKKDGQVIKREIKTTTYNEATGTLDTKHEIEEITPYIPQNIFTLPEPILHPSKIEEIRRKMKIIPACKSDTTQ